MRGDIFERRFPTDEALGELEAILSVLVLLDEAEQTFQHLCSLLKRYQVYGKAVHDANIVATMLTYGITRLMTYNSDDFRRFQEITIEPV